MTKQQDMAHNSIPHFLIIDDDPINNHICERYLELVFPDVRVTAFTNPQQGITYIMHEHPKGEKTVLLLDINMPVLSGWDVLEIFESLSARVKEQFQVYILSSSIAPQDKAKASGNPHVSGFIEKPLSIGELQTLFPQYARKDLEDI